MTFDNMHATHNRRGYPPAHPTPANYCALLRELKVTPHNHKSQNCLNLYRQAYAGVKRLDLDQPTLTRLLGLIRWLKEQESMPFSRFTPVANHLARAALIKVLEVDTDQKSRTPVDLPDPERTTPTGVRPVIDRDGAQ